jgi:transglutaminase-like putative cysteine protease
MQTYALEALKEIEMNYKKVLEYMKEQAFGLDREQVRERDPDPSLPDSFDEETTFLEQDGEGNVVELPTWVPPARSTATRKYPGRTKGHSRGALVDPKTNRAVTFASAIEMRCAVIMIASPHIAEVYDQPPAIQYRDKNGRVRKHTPDYLVVGPGGKCAIAVKPRRRVKKSGIKDIIKRVKPNLGDYADDFILLTESQLTQSRANNAESAIHANECRVQEHCDRVFEIVRDAEGELNAYHVSGLFGDFATGMNAVWCLVFDGLVKLVDPKRMLSDHPFIVTVRNPR